jgi:hypothetical protein
MSACAPVDRGVPDGRDGRPAGSLQLDTERSPPDRWLCEPIAQIGCITSRWAVRLDCSRPSPRRDPWGMCSRRVITNSSIDRRRFEETGRIPTVAATDRS